MLDMDGTEALERVNEANWSKFDNGNPYLDANGKIKKGPNLST